MKIKNKTFWVSIAFAILLAGCSSYGGKYPQKYPGIEEESKEDTVQPTTSQMEPVQKPANQFEDDEGYRIRPVEIEIEAGRPYLPVGAEIVSREGDVPLNRVITRLADLKGFSVSWAHDVRQARLVSVKISPADNFWDALDNVLRPLDYFYDLEQDTIVVQYKETKKYYLPMPSVSETFTSSIGGNMLPSTGQGGTGVAAQSRLVVNSPAHVFWNQVSNALDQIVDCDGCPSPIINRTMGMITVTAPKRTHREVEEYLASLRKEAYKQVMLEAKILEITLSKEHSTGIDWSNIFKSRTFTGTIGLRPNIYTHGGSSGGQFLQSISITSPISWSLVVSAFREYGNTRTLANPKVNILNGRSTILSAGQQRVYLSGCEVSTEDGVITTETEVSSITEGLTVAVKPNIINDEEVILYVFPAITKLIEMRDISATYCGTLQAPETSVREMATHARVRDGEILIIGGLLQQREEKDRDKVPILGDIPLLGKYLFSHESLEAENLELVILIRPRIIQSEGFFAERVEP